MPVQKSMETYWRHDVYIYIYINREVCNLYLHTLNERTCVSLNHDFFGGGYKVRETCIALNICILVSGCVRIPIYDTNGKLGWCPCGLVLNCDFSYVRTPVAITFGLKLLGKVLTLLSPPKLWVKEYHNSFFSNRMAWAFNNPPMLICH